MIENVFALSEKFPFLSKRTRGKALGRQAQRLRRLECLRVPPTRRNISRPGHSTGLRPSARHQHPTRFVTEYVCP